MSKNKYIKEITSKFSIGDIVEVKNETIVCHKDVFYRVPSGIKFKVLTTHLHHKCNDYNGSSYYEDIQNALFDYVVSTIEPVDVRGSNKLFPDAKTFHVLNAFEFLVNGFYIKAAKQKDNKPAKEKKVKLLGDFKEFPLSREEKFPTAELPQLKKAPVQELSKKEKKEVEKAAKGTKKKGNKLASELTKKHEKKQKNKNVVGT